MNDATRQLNDLAGRVNHFTPVLAGRIDRLQADLNDDEQRTRWGIPAVQAMLDDDAIVARYVERAHRRWRTALGLAEWLRNVLVLCPIVVTWYGLSTAAES